MKDVLLNPSVVLSSILSSVILWIVTVVIAVSCAALIFQGMLTKYAAFGIGIALVSAIFINLVLMLFSTDSATVGIPQNAPVLIQASLVGGYVTSAPASMSSEQILIAAVSIIILSAFLSGLALMLLSVGRIGSLIRYVPYPVMGGFLAGSGWLLILDSFSLTTGIGFSFDLNVITALLQGPNAIKWLPGMAFAFGLVWALRRSGNFALLPLGIVAGVAVFYAMLFLSGVGIERAMADGWFMTTIDTASWAQLSFSNLELLMSLPGIDLPFVLASAGTIATLTIITLLNVLINLSGQEMIVGREIKLNFELTVTGFANLVSSVFGGGIISFPCLACASLVNQMKAYGRLVMLLICLMLALALSGGAELIGLFPRVVIGGLLAYIGVDFLIAWLYDTWGKLSRKDYLIVLIMLLIIAASGFIAGMVAGVFLSLLLFVVEYARLGAVKQDFRGDEYLSAMHTGTRNESVNRVDRQVWILRLRGMLFFGASHQFYRRVKSRLDNQPPGSDELKYIILDFQMVEGIDISTVMDFNKVRKLAERHNIQVLLSNVPPPVRRVLIDSSFAVKGADDLIDCFHDLDHAMQWCERKLLNHLELEGAQDASISEVLNRYIVSHELDFDAFERFLERLDIGEDEMLAFQGDNSDRLFFLESGRVHIELNEGNRIVHLRTITGPTVIGEMGFYLDQPRSANVVAAEPSVVYSLSRESLERMQTEDPVTAAAFHSFTSAILSERLTATNRMVQALTG